MQLLLPSLWRAQLPPRIGVRLHGTSFQAAASVQKWAEWPEVTSSCQISRSSLLLTVLVGTQPTGPHRLDAYDSLGLLFGDLQ